MEGLLHKHQAWPQRFQSRTRPGGGPEFLEGVHRLERFVAVDTGDKVTARFFADQLHHAFQSIQSRARIASNFDLKIVQAVVPANGPQTYGEMIVWFLLRDDLIIFQRITEPYSMATCHRGQRFGRQPIRRVHASQLGVQITEFHVESIRAQRSAHGRLIPTAKCINQRALHKSNAKMRQ